MGKKSGDQFSKRTFPSMDSLGLSVCYFLCRKPLRELKNAISPWLTQNYWAPVPASLNSYCYYSVGYPQLFVLTGTK